MKLVITILKELYGLFVEDGSYALTIVIWIAAAALLLPHLAEAWRAPLLFAGVAALLVENVVRTARN